MIKSLNGGNPMEDRKASQFRFDNILHPIFSSKGYVRLKNSNTLYSESDNTLIITTSAPSQTKHYRDLKEKVRQFRKQYGKELSIYLVYSRNYSEWANKPVYQSTLRSILRLGSITGISVGLDNMEKLLHNISKKIPFHSIQ